MRGPALLLLRAGLLAGPAALGFAKGGFFQEARIVAALAAWALVALAALAIPGPLAPPSRAARAALIALAGLVAWTWVSASWAPRRQPADQALELGLLYLPALAAATLAFRDRAAARAVEPALALGTLVVVGYGLAGRLVPDVVSPAAGARAGGRLEQPLTYWNAMGALAAIGVVLCASLAGYPARRPALRGAAAAAAAPLGMGVYLSFSRGALAALLVGLLALVLLSPTWPQLRAAALAAEAAAFGAAVAVPFDAVRALQPGPDAGQGAAALALLLAVAAAAAVLQRLGTRDERAGAARAHALALHGRRRRAAAAALIAVAFLPFVLALADPGGETAGFGASTRRLSEAGSNRGEYWEAALATWADHPIAGAGAGSFGVEWLRRRDISERVQDAHSLPLETAAELGLIGLALLAAFATAVVLAARTLLRTDRALAAGPAAALAAWALHASLDWDWEMPALTLVAVVLAGTVLARADQP